MRPAKEWWMEEGVVPGGGPIDIEDCIERKIARKKEASEIAKLLEEARNLHEAQYA